MTLGAQDFPWTAAVGAVNPRRGCTLRFANPLAVACHAVAGVPYASQTLWPLPATRPPPASRVQPLFFSNLHGFADSPVATLRHPLRGFARGLPLLPPTGSRTHPWLNSVTHFVGSRDSSGRYPRSRTRGNSPSSFGDGFDSGPGQVATTPSQHSPGGLHNANN